MANTDEIILGPGAFGDPENPEQSREEFLANDKDARRDVRKAEREAERNQEAGQ